MVALRSKGLTLVAAFTDKYSSHSRRFATVQRVLARRRPLPSGSRGRNYVGAAYNVFMNGADSGQLDEVRDMDRGLLPSPTLTFHTDLARRRLR